MAAPGAWISRHGCGNRPRQYSLPRERRCETRLQGVDLRRVREVVCRSYQIEPSEIGRRGSRHEAAGRWRTWHGAYGGPNSELAEVLGVADRTACRTSRVGSPRGWRRGRTSEGGWGSCRINGIAPSRRAGEKTASLSPSPRPCRPTQT